MIMIITIHKNKPMKKIVATLNSQWRKEDEAQEKTVNTDQQWNAIFTILTFSNSYKFSN